MPHVRHAHFCFALVATLTVMLAFVLTGCSSTEETIPPSIANPIEIPATSYAAVFKESGLLIRDRGFVVDRQDLRFGLITSRPRISPTFAEPWNNGNTTGDQIISSTISNQRRIIRISLLPTGTLPPTTLPANTDSAQTQPDDAAETPLATPTGTYTLRVEVFLERAQQPTRRLSGSMNSGSAFNDLRAVPTELSRRGIEPYYWEPMGHDSYYEQRLLADLLERTGLNSEQ